MKKKLVVLIITMFVMSVLMASTCFAAVKDYATLQWDVNLTNIDLEGTIKITLTGVVGEQVDDDHVNLATLPDAYGYTYPFIGHPDYSPNKPGDNVPITGYKVHSYQGGEMVIVPREKIAQTIIEFGESFGPEKKSQIKLIPVVEGSKMTIELGATGYFQHQQDWTHAFPGTTPLLTVRGGKSYFYQMWGGDKAQTYTFKKTINDHGTFQIYPFPDEFHDLGSNIAFYVVTEAEAKALMADSGLSNGVPFAQGLTATPTASTVLVNGKKVSFEAYSIAGNNYFKLRDLAKVVSGTSKQFAVGYDNATNAITLTSQKAYNAVGGELSKGDGKAKTATATKSKIYVNGKETSFTAYNIGGNNYFKLRDIAEVFGIGVGWDGVTNTITVDTAIASVVPPKYVRLEAEDGDIYFAYKAPIKRISGGEAVEFEYADGSVTFKNSPSATSLTFGYANIKNTRNVNLYVNGEKIDTFNFPNTHGYNDYQEITFNVEIPKDAEVMVRLGSDDLIYIDYIDFITE